MIDKCFFKIIVIVFMGRDFDIKNFKGICFVFVFLFFKFLVVDSWWRVSEIMGVEIVFDRLNICNLLSF